MMSLPIAALLFVMTSIVALMFYGTKKLSEG